MLKKIKSKLRARKLEKIIQDTVNNPESEEFLPMFKTVRDQLEQKGRSTEHLDRIINGLELKILKRTLGAE